SDRPTTPSRAISSIAGVFADCKGVLPPSDDCGSSAQPSGITMANFIGPSSRVQSSRFKVQGSKFGLFALGVFAAAKDRFLQIAHEAVDHLTDSLGVFIHFVELLLRDVTLVERY